MSKAAAAVGDRRSITSKKNLGAHIPAPISDQVAIIHARVPAELVERLDAVRGEATRSQWLRDLLERVLAEEESPG